MSLYTTFLDLIGQGPATENKRRAQRQVATAHEEFKTAVREGDIPAIEALLGARRIAVSDELDRGRGLLQFAVMSNAVKVVRCLVAAGASTTTKDSLGASAAKLGRSKGGDAMAKALEGRVATAG